MPILLATRARGHFLPVCGKHIEEGAQSQTRPGVCAGWRPSHKNCPRVAQRGPDRKRMLPSQVRGSRPGKQSALLFRLFLFSQLCSEAERTGGGGLEEHYVLEATARAQCTEHRRNGSVFFTKAPRAGGQNWWVFSANGQTPVAKGACFGPDFGPFG